MNKYIDEGLVQIVGDYVWIGQAVVKNFEDAHDLNEAVMQMIREAARLRTAKKHARMTDPATYGTAICGLVRIGKGETVWTLERIVMSWKHPGEAEAWLVGSGGNTRRVNPTRLVPVPQADT